MKPFAFVLVLVLAVVAGACAKDKRGDASGGGGGPTDMKTPEGAIRGFVAALLAGNLAGAEAFLPDEKTCAQFPAEQAEHCVGSLARLKAALPQIQGDLKDFQVGQISLSPDPVPGKPEGVTMYVVAHAQKPDDKFELITIKSGTDYRVAFPIKMKEAPPPPG